MTDAERLALTMLHERLSAVEDELAALRQQVGDAASGVIAVQVELGINPSGPDSDVAARLARFECKPGPK
jgi:hypothetical protein